MVTRCVFDVFMQGHQDQWLVFHTIIFITIHILTAQSSTCRFCLVHALSSDEYGHLFYRPVYFFGHRDSSSVAKYISLETSAGLILQLSPTHFIPTCTSGCHVADAAEFPADAVQWVYKYASAVKVGDIVLSVASSNMTASLVVVETISETMEIGLFNPYIRGANIVVNGIVASPHSQWILDTLTPNSLTGYLPHIYEVMLMPVFAIYLAVGPVVGEWLVEGLGLAEDASGANDAYIASTFCLPIIVLAVFIIAGRNTKKAVVK